MNGARVFVHPAFLQRYPLRDVVAYFGRIDRVLSNASSRRIEARPAAPVLVDVVERGSIRAH